jgi:hypothetical protein
MIRFVSSPPIAKARSTIGLHTELMHRGRLHAVWTIPRFRNLKGGAGKESRPQGVHSGRHNSKISKAPLHRRPPPPRGHVGAMNSLPG